MSALRRCSLSLAITSLAVVPALAQRASLFQELAGNWAGSGEARASNEAPEALRCRAGYATGGPASLQIDLVCASDSFKLQSRTYLRRRGDHLDGSFTEATTGASGMVRGAIRGNRLDADLEGSGLSAHLSLSFRGQSQVVTLVSSSPTPLSASVVLRRR